MLRGRLCAGAMLLVAALMQAWPTAPPLGILTGAALGLSGSAVLWWRLGGARRDAGWFQAWLVLAAMVCMAAYVGWRIDLRLADVLPTADENRVSRVVLRITTLPRMAPDSRQFEAQVLSARPAGLPSHVLVHWTAAGFRGPYARGDAPPQPFPEIIPGQVWRMAMVVRSVHGARNPAGFDYERHVFAQGIRALGNVRGNPRLVRDDGWYGLSVAAERARYFIRRAMLPHLEGMRWGAVLPALAIGDQAGVSAADWEVFNRSGMTHLVSISGSHVTLLAAVGAWLVNGAWRRARWRGRALAERLPAALPAALAALLIAWAYCLLAGWGVPARRTFIMLSVVALARAAALPLSASRLLMMAALVVVVLDPWALLAGGFWLSFGAVYVLLASGEWWGRAIAGGEPASVWRSRLAAVRMAVVLQLAITAALMPLLALLFSDVSLVSPLVNAYAIPVVELIVTPAALASAGLALVPGLDWFAQAAAWVGHTALAWTMKPTVWLAGWSWSSFTVPAVPPALTLLALAGLGIAVAPYGLPWRRLGWLLMLPALFWRPAQPEAGYWSLTALDVGQGSAVVIRSAKHTLVFDTGLRHSADSDEGLRTVVPYLRSLGVKTIDALVVSHADMDHVGGTRAILMAFPVRQTFSSFDLKAHLARESRLLGRPEPRYPLVMSRCQYGQIGRLDGVDFQFLWPLPGASVAVRRSSARNAVACVMRVSGSRHSALLSADIGADQEAGLVARQLMATDVVVAPHHGSNRSSSPGFVRALGASHVIYQCGLGNRYGHPDKAVVARWRDAGAENWRTDRDGALTIVSSPDGLSVKAERHAHPRYWQYLWGAPVADPAR